MKEQLTHILDQSVCLSRKQMKEYLSGAMQQEEMHAAEMHLNACPLCSMAMEGFEAHSEEALSAIASLNSGFLKEHFDNIAPQIHLNSMAPAAALPAGNSARKQHHVQPLWRNASVAAALVLLFGVLWYIEFGREDAAAPPKIAMAERNEAPAAVPSTTGSRSPQSETQRAAGAGLAELQKEDQAATSPEDEIVMASKPAAAVPATAPAAPPAAGTRSMEPEDAVRVAPAQSVPETVANLSKKPAKEIDVKMTRAYKMPLKEPAAQPLTSVRTAEQIEKSATRNASDIAALSTQVYQGGSNGGLSIGGGRGSNTKYVVDGVQTEAAAERKKADKEERSQMELADDSFSKGKYAAALSQYKQQMNAGSPREKAKAGIMAARCYAAMGNKAKAEELLQKIVSEGPGPERREARRVLRSLE